ncbi:MAG: hypothetical protein F4X11_20650 [Acidobacteria bacterium]|nr:hypothetical protein [Acidobacteriota bacterium]
MIKLTRTAEPPAGFAGEQRIEKNLALIRLRQDGKKPSNKVWKQAKTHLKAESHGKCAYCESDTSTVAYGDVEHFRPQSVYWWLAYCYDNFSYSCQLCNQMYKIATFRVAREARRWRGPAMPAPTEEIAAQEHARLMTPDPRDRATGGMPFDEFLRSAIKEKPFLVDPYVEDPEELYGWEADPVLKEVRVTARTNRIRAIRAIRAAEDDLGLNREELRRRRWQNYEVLKTLADVIKTLPPDHATEAKEVAAAAIRAMMAPEREYAAMARYFVRVEWRLDVTTAEEQVETPVR